MRLGDCSLNIFRSFVILLSSLKFTGLCAAKKEITKVIKKAIFIIITPHKMVSTARFELTASKLGILRSILLSYEDRKREKSR